jgi:arylsulfatase A-like enzyme
MPLLSARRLIAIALAAFSMLLAPLAALASDKPNIVVIVADDLGNADLGYRGSPIRTPNLDALAKGGVRLESYYGQQLCTPARAALMTGRYPMRYGLQTFVIFPAHKYGLPTDETTLPQALKQAGYSTAMVGKWHLGHADRKFWPQNRGFDHFYGNLVGEVDYFTKERGGIVDWRRNGQFLKEKGYYTTLIGDEAVRIIEKQDPKKPLFLYVASLAVHAPLQAPEADIDAYKGAFDNAEKRAYAAMLTSLDKQVGRIVAALEKKGMRENTLIFFTSDNGGIRKVAGHAPGGKPAKEPPASNGVFRDGKASLYEGGVRVPAFVNWPAKLKPAVVNEPLHHVDVMPTLLAIAGAQGNPAKPFDGRNAWATLAEGKPSPHEDVLINVEVYRGAVRKGPWKLVKHALLPGKTELFDLAKDPGEKTNVAAENPEVVKDLEARLIAYAKEQKPSLWLLAQPAFLGPQGETAFDPGFDIDDGGLPQEKPVLPKN